MYDFFWMLAKKLHIPEDLNKPFEQEEDITNDIITLACYPCVEHSNLSHAAEWQQYTKTMSNAGSFHADLIKILHTQTF